MATPDTSNPWAWNQWAQTQDPGLYGFKNARGNGALAPISSTASTDGFLTIINGLVTAVTQPT